MPTLVDCSKIVLGDGQQVINIEKITCRPQPMQMVGWRKEMREGIYMDRGPLGVLVQIVHTGKTTAVLRERLGNDRRVASALDGVAKPRGRSRPWIFFWSLANVHASEGTLATVKAPLLQVALCLISPQIVLAAVRRGRFPQVQEQQPEASEHRSCPVRHPCVLRHHGDLRQKIKRGEAGGASGQTNSGMTSCLCRLQTSQ